MITSWDVSYVFGCTLEASSIHERGQMTLSGPLGLHMCRGRLTIVWPYRLLGYCIWSGKHKLDHIAVHSWNSCAHGGCQATLPCKVWRCHIASWKSPVVSWYRHMPGRPLYAPPLPGRRMLVIIGGRRCFVTAIRCMSHHIWMNEARWPCDSVHRIISQLRRLQGTFLVNGCVRDLFARAACVPRGYDSTAKMIQSCSICDDCKEHSLQTEGGVRGLLARAACVPRFCNSTAKMIQSCSSS